MLARWVGCEVRGSLEVFGDGTMGRQKFLVLVRSLQRMLRAGDPVVEAHFGGLEMCRT